MKIAFFEIKPWEIEYLKKKFAQSDSFELIFYEADFSEDVLSEISDIEVLSVFIYSQVTKQKLDKLPKLRLIATRSTGFDHIDLNECHQRNIIISTVPFYGENTIAEHTFALILSLTRNIHKSYVRTQLNNFSIEGLKGFDLKGKTIGVVGLGRIGMHVAKIARGFGMKVLGFDVNQDKFLADLINFEYVSFEDLLAQSDIVTLHVPYNKHTHHLINSSNISLMKKGSILINTARGSVVETEALLEAIEKDIFYGVGLDVIEGEEYIKEEKQILYDPDKLDIWQKILRDRTILRKENVVFTPHIAFYSQEALERILETTYDNIIAFNANKPQFIVK